MNQIFIYSSSVAKRSPGTHKARVRFPGLFPSLCFFVYMGSYAAASLPSLRRVVRPSSCCRCSCHLSHLLHSLRQEKHTGEEVTEAGRPLSSILSLLSEHERMFLALLASFPVILPSRKAGSEFWLRGSHIIFMHSAHLQLSLAVRHCLDSNFN